MRGFVALDKGWGDGTPRDFARICGLLAAEIAPAAAYALGQLGEAGKLVLWMTRKIEPTAFLNRELRLADSAGWLGEAERLGLTVPPRLRAGPPRRIERGHERILWYEFATAAALAVLAWLAYGLKAQLGAITVIAVGTVLAVVWLRRRIWVDRRRLEASHVVCGLVTRVEPWRSGGHVTGYSVRAQLVVDGQQCIVGGMTPIGPGGDLKVGSPVLVLLRPAAPGKRYCAGAQLLLANAYWERYPAALA